MRCPKCGHEFNPATGCCSYCGFRPWGVSRNPEEETDTTKLELWLTRTRNRLRIISNRVVSFEHKTLLAVLILALLGVIALAIFKPAMCR